MEKQLKVATQEVEEGTPIEPEQPQAYLVPNFVMEEILSFIGQAPWVEVNQLINYINTNIRPVFPKPTA